MEERFPKFDPNADGVVSWEEYNTQQGLITLDDAAVLNDPEQESIRYVMAAHSYVVVLKHKRDLSRCVGYHTDLHGFVSLQHS